MRWHDEAFHLHAALPDQIVGDWGYRRMTAYSGFVVPEGDARHHVPARLHWLSESVVIAHRSARQKRQPSHTRASSPPR
jgi:hypothetical protein